MNPDGAPSELCRQFRNPTTRGAAVAKAIKIGYKPLHSINEYFYDLKDAELLAAIVQTGTEVDNSTARFTLATLKNLKSFASFGESEAVPEKAVALPASTAINSSGKRPLEAGERGIGLNLSYTINLNLPATADQAVFNAIFAALRNTCFRMARNEILSEIKAFGMTNQILTEDLHRIGVTYAVDLGHAAITSKVEDVYYPQFDAKLREEAAAMARHYEVFYCLEKAIRVLVSETIETAEKTDDWWKTTRVPQNIKSEVAARSRRSSTRA